MNMTVNTRSVILDALIEICEKNEYTHKVLSEALNKYRFLENTDRSFINRTVLGTVERKITIDYILNLYSKTPVDKMKPVIRNILRMSVYQLVYMESMKDFAVCNEAVKLAAKRGFVNLKGYVNGVLRNIARNTDNIRYPDENDFVKYMSVAYSTPEWIIENWEKEYGRTTTEGILKAQFCDRPLMIRCNLSKCSADELAYELKSQGVCVKKSGIIPEALEISEYDYLEKVDAFNNGLFSVQDLSSMLVCHACTPVKGYVLDLCAAPGGKSLHIAETLKGSGMVESRDVSEYKVSLIDDNIKRLGLSNIKTRVRNACDFEKESEQKADYVIADVPCSGLGILNKKPDIKYHASADKCKELVILQRQILSNACRYVKPGGVLCFSTCTINSMENGSNVKWILDNFPFEIVDIRENIPESLHRFINDDNTMQILPDEEGNYDGFFIAVLKRT